MINKVYFHLDLQGNTGRKMREARLFQGNQDGNDIERAAGGELALSDAISMATLVNKHFETLEGAELLERLKRLEDQYESKPERD